MGSKTTVNTVKGWLSMCEGGDRCVAKRRAVSDPIIPTRLIDVHTYGSQFWSVVETNNHQSFSKYVALSHRWVADTPRLLRNNYLAFQMGQSDDVVPRSYQDVFVLCRKLDIRYVWIDSLCIFQDSADDFLHEAATMIEVYANAFCTFSIGWESPHGFLRPRNTRALLRWNTDNLNGLVPPDRHLFVHDHRELRETIGQTPLNRRGWVLQEQLLSPRILHLGNDQLYWECDGRISSETEPDGLLPHGSDYRRKMLVDNGESESSTWQDLVVQFMRLDLTFERDRLLAVSGIARFLLTSSENGLPEGNGSYSYRKVERKVDPTTEYVAGLRRFHWIKDLLWQPMIFPQRWIEDDVKVNRGSFNRCPDNIVPSWSWAACPGPIRWTVEPFDVWHHDVSDEGGPVACLRNINFELLGSDIYGLPKSASLDISGLLIPAKHTELDGPEYHPNGVEATSNQQYFYLYTDGFMYPLPYPRVHGDVRSLITAPLESCDSFTPTCFIIPLISLSIWKDPKTMGLVVQERPRAGDGLREFVRVGSFTRYHKPDHNRQDCAGLAIMNAILKNVPADGDKFEQKLRDSAYWWEDYERAGMEDGHDATAKAEWTTIRLV
ncbi:uncharacterized protein FIESC28_02824 [Fusarium coffeatum]|uniref:Heterokaryon incompatibility domain-containing protein n=1 Tax=Fusarium coffeatum TaxID=231269 RepID=A0A366S4U1_9HYPO|nr:uncharacterized protein FIESC28_02824 [Fusarium coffeatum]RBR24334.1 hypothetical protein FIESC28_02824 [Fusarium coffeatum]